MNCIADWLLCGLCTVVTVREPVVLCQHAIDMETHSQRATFITFKSEFIRVYFN